RATDDGYQGYMPVTARYTGNGNFVPMNPIAGPPIRRTSTIYDTNFAALNAVVGNSEAFLERSSEPKEPTLDNPKSLAAEGKEKSASWNLSVSFELGTYYQNNGNQANGPTIIKWGGQDLAG